ncbi:hypothetical protein [uncultured Gordonia sp.]|uniref:hypothetical protein n=1 Tax=Gordonia sp. (in: high G+C Gram-positive bacteria) TaxID=84139 RepID=UPI002613B59C|nr:hypothetical protein [uncultured Gordonia sp.]HNP57628.1 hypothetical protein [Gordonia sp. (in: high G+C Gram-positive bacteria)]
MRVLVPAGKDSLIIIQATRRIGELHADPGGNGGPGGNGQMDGTVGTPGPVGANDA